MEFLELLLPDSENLRIDRWNFSEDQTTVEIHVLTVSADTPCPVCQQTTRNIHSRYQRQLMDLPLVGYRIKLLLQVRKFFCPNANCKRRIFCERLPSIVRAWGGRTERLRQAQRHIGLSLGGAPGKRLSQQLALPAGGDLLLTLVRETNIPKEKSLYCVGVDDWAQRKGCRYGTIIVDLKWSVIVDILPDRTAETVANWLRKHPTIRVVGRDRASSYAQAVREILPMAKQVADRWHLLKNMTDTLYKILQRNQRQVKVCVAELRQEGSRKQALLIEKTPSPLQPTQADECRQQRIALAKILSKQGMTQKEIAQKLDCHPKTISRDLAGLTPTVSTRSKRSSILDPFKGYLQQRIRAGCVNASQLFAEIQKQGYQGKITTVRTFIRPRTLTKTTAYSVGDKSILEKPLTPRP